MNVFLDKDFSGDVYFYYGLSNYYQNARRYLRSWNSDQLMGDLGCTTRCSDPYKVRALNISEVECGKDYILGPEDSCKGSYWRAHEKKCIRPIAPCGAVANSMFTGNLLNFISLYVKFV